jgi:hypothetical protein
VDWDNLDWADIFRRLVLFAYRRRQSRGAQGSLADAEDLAAEAIRRLLDTNFADWNRGAEPDLLRHLGSTVNGLLSNELRGARFKVERSLSDPNINQIAEQFAVTSVRGIEEVDENRRMLSLLEARVAQDMLVSKLLQIEEKGITKPATQAEHLKVAISIVYKARRRLARHREAVRKELAAENSRTNGHHRAKNTRPRLRAKLHDAAEGNHR